jgi:glycosyltransferase involved in cell wall biosynthesis
MHLVIIQTALFYLDNKSYNRQETGLAKSLAKRGYKVSLIYTGKKVFKENICKNVSIYHLKCVMLNPQIGTYKSLWKTLDMLKPDLLQIHEMGMFMSFYALKWAQKNNVRCVLIQGPYELTRKPVFRQLERLFDKYIGTYILKHVDGVGCKTPSAKDFLMKYFTRDYFQTPVGLDETNFMKKKSIGVLRKNFNISEEKRILLYVGVNERRRHVDLLIETFRKLSNDYVLVIVGEGPEKEKLKSLTTTETRIIWLDKMPQEKLLGIYNDADLFLLASDYEIYGMVILESMYYNVPVLSTITGGARALIEDNKTGYLIDSFNSDDWANKIEMIFSNKVLYEKIRNGLHDYINENLLWDVTCEKFINLYKNAFDKSKKE